MTPQDFYNAGFSACLTPPACWQQEPGHFFVRPQAQGTAYVRYLSGEPDEIEAFVGDWSRPWLYWFCQGCRATLPQLLHRLG